MTISQEEHNGINIISCENEYIKFQIAPQAGGKIISIYNKSIRTEFLWKNQSLTLETHVPGTDYDSNFFGGMDELIPNDVPENVDGLNYPDHGELWTTRLNYFTGNNQITVEGKLPLSELHYTKTVRLDPDQPVLFLDYIIRNESESTRHFLWKLHAALNIEAGDQMVTTAKKAKVVDPLYSRFKYSQLFNWPVIENEDASYVPERENSTDFFYLFNPVKPEMGFVRTKSKSMFLMNYDRGIFPFQWYFASYGGFLNHYTAILEPCTSMPMLVNEAMASGHCTILKPGEELKTTVSIYAGKIKYK